MVKAWTEQFSTASRVQQIDIWGELSDHGVKALAFDIENTLGPLGCRELSEEIVEFLAQLYRTYQFKICLATNSSRDFRYMRFQLLTAAIPSDMVCIVQPTKPNRKPWQVWKAKRPVKRQAAYWRRVVATCGCSPLDAVMIGDKLLHDVKPALKAGFYHAIWVAPLGDDLPLEFIRRWYERIVCGWYGLKRPFLPVSAHAS